MQLGEFISKLAAKSGIPTDDPSLVELLQIGEVFKANIGDDVANKINQSLMTTDAALANSDIRNKIKAEVLNGTDAELFRLASENQLPDEDLAALKSLDNTNKRIGHFVAKVKELEAKKAGSTKGADKEVYTKQVEELNAQIRTLRDTSTAQLNDLKAQHDGEITGLMFKTLLSGKEYSLPKEMPTDRKVSTVYGVIQDELAAKGVKIVRENGQLTLQKKADGTPYYNESNVAMSVTDFADSVLAANGLQVVNKPNTQQPSGGNMPPQGGQGGVGAQNLSGAQAVDTLLAGFDLPNQ